MIFYLVYEAKSREILSHAFRETIKSRGLFHSRKEVKFYGMRKLFGCSRFVGWHVARTSQLCCIQIQSQPYSKIDEEHI